MVGIFFSVVFEEHCCFQAWLVDRVEGPNCDKLVRLGLEKLGEVNAWVPQFLSSQEVCMYVCMYGHHI